MTSPINSNINPTAQDPNATSPVAGPLVNQTTTSSTASVIYDSTIAASTSSTKIPSKTGAASGATSLQEPGISIADYAKVIMSAKKQLEESAYSDMAKDTILTQGYYISVIENCLGLRELLTWSASAKDSMDKMNTDYNALVPQVNATIDNFNTTVANSEPFLPPPNDTVRADAPMVAEMNQATTNYNNAKAASDQANANYDAAVAAFNAAPSTATYNAAKAAYDAAASTTTYNAATTTYTNATNTFNTAQTTYDQAVAAHNAGKMSDANFKTAQDTYNNAKTTYDTATTTYNAATTAYNAAPATATYNAALLAYNTAPTTTAVGAAAATKASAAAAFTAAQAPYNAAVTKYDAYAAERNAQLAPLIDAYNKDVRANFNTVMKPVIDQINAYNSIAAGVGAPLLPLPTPPQDISKTYVWQTIALSPTKFPIPAVPARPGPVPPISNIYISNTEEVQAMIKQAVGTSVDLMMGRLLFLDSYMRNTSASSEYYTNKQKSINAGANALINNAYIESIVSKQPGGGATKGSGSGQFSSLLGGNDSSGFSVILSKELNSVLPPELNNLFKQAQIELLVSSGVPAGARAMGILGDALSHISPHGHASHVSVALGFAKQNQSLSHSGIFETAIQRSLQAAGMTPGKESLTLGAQNIKLTTALISAFEISRALGTPGLLRQLIGLAGGNSIPGLKDLLSLTPGTKLSEALGDPFAVTSMKMALTERLASEGGMSLGKAESIVDKVLTRVLNNPSIKTEGDLRKALRHEFQNQKLGFIKSLVLARMGVDVLRDEMTHPELNLALDRPKLENTIRQHEFFTDSGILNALNKALKSDGLDSQRALKKELVSEFRLQGDSRSEAVQKAKAILNFVNLVAVNSRTIPSSSIDQESFKLNLTNQISNTLSLSAKQSQEITDKVVAQITAQKSFENNVALNDAVIAALKSASIPTLRAQLIAENTIIPINPSASGVDPLVQKGNVNLLQGSELADAIRDKVIKLLRPELETAKSHEISKEVIATLMGDKSTSLVSVIQDSIKMFLDKGNKELEGKFADTFRNYLSPSVDLYKFAQELVDPGNSVVYSASTGLMYAKNEPSNFKKSIDVQI